MRIIIAAATCFLVLACPSHAASPAQSPEEQAIQVAQAWLASIDAGEYEKSWDDAAVLFKQAITKEQWRGTLEAHRTPLGGLTSRTVKSAEFSTSLPGAPDGEYVVIQFDASFANKQAAIETVTPMKDPDGVWRVSGYYIK